MPTYVATSSLPQMKHFILKKIYHSKDILDKKLEDPQ